MVYLGIDGGGTKTTALVGDETRTLGEAAGAAININKVGREAAEANLRATINAACETAGIAAGDVAKVCIGAAGTSNAANREAIRVFAAALLPNATVEVVGDHHIALHASFGDGPGVVVIAGTGSIAIGRNAKGELARVGGWGPLVSDEGSAHWIGRETVRAALRSLDAGQGTQVLRAIFKHWGVGSHQDAVKLVNSVPPPRFADLFPLVADAADARDTLASTIMQRAGEELALLAAAVMHRLCANGEVTDVAFAGGVFKRSHIVREVFALSLPSHATLRSEVVEPVAGALALARRA